MSTARLSQTHKEVLIELYRQIAETVDALPYTLAFDRLRSEFAARTGLVLSLHEFWRALSAARKAGKLVRKER